MESVYSAVRTGDLNKAVCSGWQRSLHQYRQLSLGDSSPYTSTDKQIRINIRKETIQNTVNESTHIPKHPHITTLYPHTHTHTHARTYQHITQPVKTTTLQDTHQIFLLFVVCTSVFVSPSLLPIPFLSALCYDKQRLHRDVITNPQPLSVNILHFARYTVLSNNIRL
jgi:hypothetical protein